jgi:hypothetical protein
MWLETKVGVSDAISGEAPFVADLLRQAGRGDGCAWCLSEAMVTLDRLVFGAPDAQISKDTLSDLEASLLPAMGACWDAGCSTDVLIDGFHSLRLTFCRWATPATARPRVPDLRDRLRIFRNHMHNLSLEEVISQRRLDRSLSRPRISIEEWSRMVSSGSVQ